MAAFSLVLWSRPTSVLLRYDDCQHRVPALGTLESDVVSIGIAQNRITVFIDQVKVCDSCHRFDSASDVTGEMAELYMLSLAKIRSARPVPCQNQIDTTRDQFLAVKNAEGKIQRL
jgi:hypothetical protein